MPAYYEDTRLTVTEHNGRYNIFDRKYNREIHKNVDKEWTDNFINRVISKRKRSIPERPL